MTMKNKARISWGLWVWLAFWILGFFQMEPLLWKAVWMCLAIIYVGAYFLIRRKSIDTESGLRRVSGVLLGLMCVQIAVVIFIAFEAAAKK